MVSLEDMEILLASGENSLAFYHALNWKCHYISPHSGWRFNSPWWSFHVTNFSSHFFAPPLTNCHVFPRKESFPWWKSKSMRDNKFYGFMFEAVKLVSPSSSLSLFLPLHPHQLSTENNKDFSHFSQPHAVEKKESSSSGKASVSIPKGKQVADGITALCVPHSPTTNIAQWSRKRLVIYLKMIIFKGEQQAHTTILVIFYSFNGRRECSEQDGKSGGERKMFLMILWFHYKFSLCVPRSTGWLTLSLHVHTHEGFLHSFPPLTQRMDVCV